MKFEFPEITKVSFETENVAFEGFNDDLGLTLGNPSGIEI
mgnify:CR=1 FL=1